MSNLMENQDEGKPARDEGPFPCPRCNGDGWTVEVRPACCGNVGSGGECRGDCVVPEQYQEVCDLCGGSGKS